ncbi:MAG: RNA 2',3'-cyclic phosphodiesterase [Thermodesulfobacteriota bacterium]
MAESIRAFIAAELPAEVKKAAAAAAETLGRKGLRLRWVKPENMHLTVKFLGDTEEELIPEVTAAMQEAVAGVAPIPLAASGLGAFPGPSNARVVWMGLSGDTARLITLAGGLDRRLAALGFPPEAKPFAAHLTLGRAWERVDGRLLARAFEQYAASRREGVEFTLDRLILFRSVLRPQGPLYTSLAEAILK